MLHNVCHWCFDPSFCSVNKCIIIFLVCLAQFVQFPFPRHSAQFTTYRIKLQKYKIKACRRMFSSFGNRGCCFQTESECSVAELNISATQELCGHRLTLLFMVRHMFFFLKSRSELQEGQSGTHVICCYDYIASMLKFALCTVALLGTI